MGTHLNQDTSSIEAELRSKLLHDDRSLYLFIIANEAFEGIASQGLTSNMIFYLMEVYHMEVATGAIILSIWNSLSSGLSIVGGFISDSYLSRFRVIATGSLFSLVVSPYHPYSYMGRFWAQTEYKTKNSSFHFC
ncbi:putative proton-dependent oligopeptide transporter family, MFS transporter superfamily [Helianthus annuus]|nr:putative proton-dependent oligopeptide transporter family, MFS transporter superfamily [Helianthus annuus]